MMRSVLAGIAFTALLPAQSQAHSLFITYVSHDELETIDVDTVSLTNGEAAFWTDNFFKTTQSFGDYVLKRFEVDCKMHRWRTTSSVGYDINGVAVFQSHNVVGWDDIVPDSHMKVTESQVCKPGFGKNLSVMTLSTSLILQRFRAGALDGLAE